MDTTKEAAKAIADVLAVIDTTDPEHPAFIDSCADSIDELVKLRGRLQQVFVALVS